MNRALIVAIVAVLGFAACASDSGSGPAGAEGDDNVTEAPFELNDDPVATSEVTAVKSYRFEPAVIEVESGTTVTWSNEDDFPHNVDFLTGDDTTLDLPIGESAEFTFEEAGEFYYECSLHPQQMRGIVTVTG